MSIATGAEVWGCAGRAALTGMGGGSKTYDARTGWKRVFNGEEGGEVQGGGAQAGAGRDLEGGAGSGEQAGAGGDTGDESEALPPGRPPRRPNRSRALIGGPEPELVATGRVPRVHGPPAHLNDYV